MGVLDKYKEQVYACLRCGICRGDSVMESTRAYYSVCPIVLVRPGFDVDYPRGKLMLARAYLEGKVKPESIADYIYMCTNCNACQLQCRIAHVPRTDYETKQPTNEPLINIPEIIEALKTDFSSKNIRLSTHERFAEWTNKEHNPYMESHEKRFAWLPNEVRASLPREAKYVYFAGCTSCYRMTEIALNTIEFYRKIQLEFAIIDEWCCGSPLWRTGRPEIAEELMKHNIKEIERAGAEYVITSCSGCYRTLKLEYPKRLEEKLNFKVIHTIELIDELLKEEKVILREDFPRVRITYHDPCHLGRHCSVYEAPREVLTKVPNATLVEMPRNREGALCCGSGGGVKAGFPDIAFKLGTLRLQEAVDVKADMLVSTCPFCKRNFVDANKVLKSGLKIYDAVELVNDFAEVQGEE